jgi:chromate reductase, NAD(P)H dehydrogenase (quinone)
VATTTLNVLGIAGSLRRGSYNRMALRAAQKLAPAGMEIEAYEGLRDIPLYDEDVRAAGLPAAVEDLRRRIAAADALLLVTSEYNYSVPGVLKNAIDWASRPPDQPFDDKPVAIMSASPGALGGARAQYHLRQCFVYLDAKLLNRPEVMIGQCAQKFAADGTLTDEATATQIGKQLEALAAWTRRLKPR